MPPSRPPLHVRKPQAKNFLFGAQASWSDKKVSNKEDSKCHVEGCKEHRIHRSIPVEAQETKKSWLGIQTTTKKGELKVKYIFCQVHTCRSSGAGKGGKFCQDPCYPEDRRCLDCISKGKEEWKFGE